jgi:hypothetical protein
LSRQPLRLRPRLLCLLSRHILGLRAHPRRLLTLQPLALQDA